MLGVAVIIVAALFLLVVVLHSFPIFLGVDQDKQSQPSAKADYGRRAQVDGGTWRYRTIFEHIEPILRRSPDAPAIACLFSPSRDILEIAAVVESRDHAVPQMNGTSDDNGPVQALHIADHTKLRANGVHLSPYNKSKVNGYHNVNGVNGSLGLNRAPNPNGHFKANSDESINGITSLWSKPISDLSNAISPSLVNIEYAEQSTFTLTYRQIHHIALRTAARLLSLGAKPESSMVMIIPNGPEYAILLWACTLLRITYIGLDLSSLDISGFTMLKHTLRSVKPQIVVAPDAKSGRIVDVAASELGLAPPICISLASSMSTEPAWTSFASLVAGYEKRHIGLADSLIVEAKSDRPNRVHTIFYTSGTSGQPKGCPLTVGGMSHNLDSQAWLFEESQGTARAALQQAHNSRAICPLQMFQTWQAGGCVVMTERGLRVDDIAEAMCSTALNPSFRPSFIVLSPPMVHELADELAARARHHGEAKCDITSVKRIQIGGDAVTKDVLVKCQSQFPQAQVFVNHGMSEGPGMFIWPFFDTRSTDIPFFGEICPVGRVAPGTRLRIWDAGTKRIASRGKLGQLHISGGSLIGSYWNGRSPDSFATENESIWFNTGDMAILNDTGLVYILGRQKDMIVGPSGPIMPAPIESCLEAYTRAQVSVVPYRDAQGGKEPFAILSSYNSKTEEQLRKQVQTALGSEYCLGGALLLGDLGLQKFPVNQTHKVRKDLLESMVRKRHQRAQPSDVATSITDVKA